MPCSTLEFPAQDGCWEAPQPEAQDPQPDARDPQPEARDPRPEARDPQPEARDPQPEARDPQPETRDPQPEARDTQPEAQDPQPEAQDPQSVDLSIGTMAHWSLLRQTKHNLVSTQRRTGPDSSPDSDTHLKRSPKPRATSAFAAWKIHHPQDSHMRWQQEQQKERKVT